MKITSELMRTTKANILGAALKINVVELKLGSTLARTERGYLVGSPQFYKNHGDEITELVPLMRPAAMALMVEAGELQVEDAA